MTINLERSIHPDLLEETLAQAEADSSAPVVNRRRRGSASPPAAESSPSGASQPPDAGDEGGSGEASVPSPEPASPPDWQAKVRELATLLKDIPRDEMDKDDTIRGWLGDAAQQRARKMLEDQRLADTSRARQEAYDRGDLYTLGQMDANDIQAQRALAQRQAEAQMNPYMLGITAWQRTLPEAVQRDVQGKTFAPGGTPQEGFQAYLQAVHESAIRHGLEDEVKKRENGLRKAELNGTVGGEMTPELDGGPAASTREITDAQVAAMTLEEFDRYFDDKGRPRPGVRVQLTRGIDVRREQSRR